MKPSAQSKSSSLNSKSKKSSKDREKRKSQGGPLEVNNHNSTEKGSPTKDSKLYAGIDGDSLAIYAEQSTVEHLNEEITNTLTEDINYRLRYIINDSLIKARLSGRNAISSYDLEQSFENLKIDRVYGAPSHPSWVPFGYQNLFYLDDKIVNLVEVALEENIYHQYSDSILTTKWLPEQKEVSKALKTYFTTMCQMIVNNDREVRSKALKNIGENPRLGPIIEWFYNFSYILLSKDITYDCLTLRALELLRVLEFSPVCRVNVSEKQLKLLVRLILQRLLKSSTVGEVLKPMCGVLAILCRRSPLRDFVILKILQKLDEVFENHALAVVTMLNSLGVDAIESIFLPNMDLFLCKVEEQKESSYTYSILELYNILCHEEVTADVRIYNTFQEYFGDTLVMFNKQSQSETTGGKRQINLASVKFDLLKTHRKITWRKSNSTKFPIEDVFDIPSANSQLGKKFVTWETEINTNRREVEVTDGRTSLLLPVFERKPVKFLVKCLDQRKKTAVRETERDTNGREDGITVGRTSLLLPVFERKTLMFREKCHDHTLSYNF